MGSFPLFLCLICAFSLWFSFFVSPQFLVNKLIVFCCQRGLTITYSVLISKSPATKQTLACMWEFFFCFLTHDAVFFFFLINPLLSLVAYIHRYTILSIFFLMNQNYPLLHFSHHSSNKIKKSTGGVKTHNTHKLCFHHKKKKKMLNFPPCWYDGKMSMLQIKAGSHSVYNNF